MHVGRRRLDRLGQGLCSGDARPGGERRAFCKRIRRPQLLTRLCACAQDISEWTPPSKSRRNNERNERKEASAPIDCGNGFGALLGSDGNEGIVGGKATSKAARGSTPSATNSVLAACMCSFRPLLAAHSQSRAPVQGATVKPKPPKTVNKTVDPKTTTTATPKGSASASGWLSWPKLCWPKVRCIICTCLIAASGGAFAYFSHVSDALLPSVVAPSSAAPGFERHAGFCDVNGGKCQEDYRGFGESAELCEQRCLELPAGARACTAVEYWQLTKRLPMCKLCLLYTSPSPRD